MISMRFNAVFCRNHIDPEIFRSNNHTLGTVRRAAKTRANWKIFQGGDEQGKTPKSLRFSVGDQSVNQAV